jgi:methanogenic corrinoid protein MtbC1
MKLRLVTPKDLALAIGASESSVRRWVDSGHVRLSRTVGGHRRITVAEAVRFIRETRSPVLRPELLGLAEHIGSAPGDPRTQEAAIANALETGDAPVFRALCLGFYVAGRTLADLFDGPIRAAMGPLGERWRDDEAAILAEHRATELCAQAVAQLRALMPLPADDAPLAIGGAVEDDAHALASLLAAAVLAEAGYRDVNFGGSTPLKLLSRAAADQRPKLVWLAINAPLDGRRAHGVEALSKQLHAHGAALVAGGRHARALPSYANLHVVRSMSELSAFARGFHGAPTPRTRSRGE